MLKLSAISRLKVYYHILNIQLINTTSKFTKISYPKISQKIALQLLITLPLSHQSQSV